MKASKCLPYLLGLGLLLSLRVPAEAQLRLSPRAGIAFSFLDTESEPLEFSQTGQTGWTAGIDGRIETMRNLYFVIGLHYQNIKADLETLDNVSVNLNAESTLQSLKTPLLLGTYLSGETGILRIHLHGGLVPEFILDVDEQADFNFDNDFVQDIQWNAAVGLGVDFTLFTANLRYDLGLNDYFEDIDGSNQVLSLTFGFVF